MKKGLLIFVGVSLILIGLGVPLQLSGTTCSQSTKVVLVRHAQTRWNVLGLLQGNADLDLDEAGRAQAQTVAHALAGKALDAVYSSPLVRALETARAIAAPHGLSVSARSAMREIGVGIYTGYHPSQIPSEARGAWAKDPDFSMPSGIPDPAGLREPLKVQGVWFEGESLNAVADRSWREIRSVAQQHCRKNVAIVTHGGIIQIALTRAKGLPVTEIRRFPVPNASVTVLEFEPDGAVVVLPEW